MTPKTIAHQAFLSMEFSRQEYWSGVSCPPLEDLPDPGNEATSPSWQADSLSLSHRGSPFLHHLTFFKRSLLLSPLPQSRAGQMTFSSLKTARLTLTLWAFSPVHMHLLDFSQLFLLEHSHPLTFTTQLGGSGALYTPTSLHYSHTIFCLLVFSHIFDSKFLLGNT